MDAALFRDMTAADLPDGLRLSRASGWNQTLEDWRLMLALGPGLFLVGLEDGRVVATGGAVRYGRELAWICMILVDPGCRGRGLGTRVFDEVLARVLEARARDGLVAIGLDATPAGRGIYAPRGFVVGPALVRMRREPGLSPTAAAGQALPSPAVAGHPKPASPTEHDDFEPARPMVAADLEAVVALDRTVFGAGRAAVLRDALAMAPGLAHIAAAGGRVRGYCFGRHGDHSDHVGPVVADDPALARTLLSAALATSRARPVIVDARASWAAALEALGFRAERPFTRMYLGDSRPPATPALELAIRGPEMG